MKKKSQKGAVLVIALLILLLMTILGIALVFHAKFDILSIEKTDNRQKLISAAENCIQEAMFELRNRSQKNQLLIDGVCAKGAPKDSFFLIVSNILSITSEVALRNDILESSKEFRSLVSDLTNYSCMASYVDSEDLGGEKDCYYLINSRANDSENALELEVEVRVYAN